MFSLLHLAVLLDSHHLHALIQTMCSNVLIGVLWMKEAPCGDRTHDRTLTKRMLCQLS